MENINDFIGSVEELPQTVMSKLTAIRGLDLEIKSALDVVKMKEEEFISNAAKMDPHERKTRYISIRMDYQKIAENSNERDKIVIELDTMTNDCLQILEQNITRLEVQNEGMTKVIEKRVEVDELTINSSMKSNEGKLQTDKGKNVALKKNRVSLNSDSSALTSQPSTSSNADASLDSINYNLDFSHGGSNVAITATASEAASATLQNKWGVKINRGTENAGGMQLTKITKELAEVATSALVTFRNPRQKSKRFQKQQVLQHQLQSVAAVTSDGAIPSTSSASTSEASTSTSAEAAWVINPDNLDSAAGKPRYYFRSHMSYGDMMKCDNPDCLLEWFHYACVDVTATPKDKWYCTKCAPTI